MSEAKVKVRLAEGQHLVLDGEDGSVHYLPGQEIELPAAEAKVLSEQGIVEAADGKAKKLSPPRRRKSSRRKAA